MQKITFFGTGLLGEPMAQRLLDAGYPLTVYNRTPAKTENLRKKGATAATNPADAAQNAGVMITMLSDYPAIRDVLIESVAGQNIFKNKTLIQMGTISPEESLQLKTQVETDGGEYLEAPVLGSIPQARNRTLIILFGGTDDQFRRFRPLLEVFGDRVHMMGEVGQGSAVKLALNQMIASITTAFSMSLGYLREKNGNIETFLEILRESSLYAPTIDKKLGRMTNRDFSNPNFPVKHLLKDVELMLTAFGKEGINTAPLQGIQEILVAGIRQGEGENDYSALYNVVHPRTKRDHGGSGTMRKGRAEEKKAIARSMLQDGMVPTE